MWGGERVIPRPEPGVPPGLCELVCFIFSCPLLFFMGPPDGYTHTLRFFLLRVPTPPGVNRPVAPSLSFPRSASTPSPSPPTDQPPWSLRGYPLFHGNPRYPVRCRGLTPPAVSRRPPRLLPSPIPRCSSARRTSSGRVGGGEGRSFGHRCATATRRVGRHTGGAPSRQSQAKTTSSDWVCARRELRGLYSTSTSSCRGRSTICGDGERRRLSLCMAVDYPHPPICVYGSFG